MSMSPPPTAEAQGTHGRHDWRHVVLGTILAFTASLAVVSLVGAIVRELGAADGSNALDVHVLDWMVDRRADGLTSVMRAVTMLGGSMVLWPLTIVGVVVLASLRRSWLACYLATVAIGASLLSSTAKAIVGRARPPLDVRLSGAGGSAFPSGHSTQAAATYVALAIVVCAVVVSPKLRRLLWVLVGAIVFGVGVSRLYLGVHWFSDVIAGWLVGAAWAFGAVRAFRPLAVRDATAAPEPGRAAVPDGLTRLGEPLAARVCGSAVLVSSTSRDRSRLRCGRGRAGVRVR